MEPAAIGGGTVPADCAALDYRSACHVESASILRLVPGDFAAFKGKTRTAAHADTAALVGRSITLNQTR
jgi:hypothetical protein